MRCSSPRRSRPSSSCECELQRSEPPVLSPAGGRTPARPSRPLPTRRVRGRTARSSFLFLPLSTRFSENPTRARTPAQSERALVDSARQLDLASSSLLSLSLRPPSSPARAASPRGAMEPVSSTQYNKRAAFAPPPRPASPPPSPSSQGPPARPASPRQPASPIAPLSPPPSPTLYRPPHLRCPPRPPALDPPSSTPTLPWRTRPLSPTTPCTHARPLLEAHGDSFAGVFGLLGFKVKVFKYSGASARVRSVPPPPPRARRAHR